MKKLFSKEVVTTAITTAIFATVLVGGILVWRDNRENGFKFKKGA